MTTPSIPHTHDRFWAVSASRQQNHLEKMGPFFAAANAAGHLQSHLLMGVTNSIFPGDNLSVSDQIKNKIRMSPDQMIPFPTFMQMALYTQRRIGREGGFYESHTSITGDFDTNPTLFAPYYGQVLSRLFPAMGHALRLRPREKFQIVEMGGGDGALAAAILDALKKESPAFYAKTAYTLVEVSPTLSTLQQHTLSRHLEQTSWIHASALEFSMDPIMGCFLSNELIDALPVHIVSMKDGKLHVRYVSLDTDGNFCTRDLPLTRSNKNHITLLQTALNIQRLYNFSLTEGEEVPVNLLAGQWLSRIASILKKGFILTIDYTYEPSLMDHPAPVSHLPRKAAVRTYGRHELGYDPLLNPGLRDVTSDWTKKLTREQGERQGLKTVFDGQEFGLFSKLCGSNTGRMQSLGLNFGVLLQAKDLALLSMIILQLALRGQRKWQDDPFPNMPPHPSPFVIPAI